MKTLCGWERLAVALSALWVSGIFLFTAYEYQAVISGDSPIKFVVLRDAKTQEEFGGLSVSEVKELGELALKKSLSPEGEPGDAEEAKLHLAASPEPVLRYSKMSVWIVVPVVCFWAFFIGVRWVAAGFRGA